MKKALPFLLIIIALVAGYFILQIPDVRGNGKPLMGAVCAIVLVAGIAILLFKQRK